jgi:limonene-1,2-epoxide hydrolase
MGPKAPPAVLDFINAFNNEDLEQLAGVLDPEVVIHSARGTRRGIDEALAWATRLETGELRQLVELESIDADGDRAVAMVRRQWWWRGSQELAREDEMGWLFELRGGRITSWRPFEDRAAALAQLGTKA